MAEMELLKFKNYQSLSEAASEKLVTLIRRKPDAIICMATGATPLLTYRLFVEKVKAQKVDVSQATFVKLDEWIGLSADHPATCEFFLRQQILQPLAISPERYISFACGEINEQECTRVVKQIAQCGGLDLCLLGIGRNGHLGLNEPDDALEPGCHITCLDERTRQHDMLKQASIPVNRGITLGLRDILAAKEVLLLVSGNGKQDVFNTFRKKKVTASVPASFLWLHPHAACFYCEN